MAHKKTLLDIVTEKSEGLKRQIFTITPTREELALKIGLFIPKVDPSLRAELMCIVNSIEYVANKEVQTFIEADLDQYKD